MAKIQKNGNKSQLKSGKTAKKSRHFSSDELVLQPWFLPQRAAFAIRGLAPPDYRHKMHHFFDDYGCMICKKDHSYGSNGMCVTCYMNVLKKLARSVRVRSKPKSQRRFDLGLIRESKLAKKLLRNFSLGNHGPTPRHGPNRFRAINPVDEALGPYSQWCEKNAD